MNRKLLAAVFYGLALLGSCLGGLFIVVIGWKTLIAGKGIGSFSLIFFIEYAILTFFLWAVGFVIQRNMKWTALYLGSIVAVGLIFVFAPIKFYPE